MTTHPRLSPRQRNGDPPASFAQQRLWLLDRVGAGAAFNVPGALRLRGPLDVGALERALESLARRHETLRTSLHGPDEAPVQRIASSPSLPLERMDLRSVPAPQRERELERLLREQTERPFDLSTAPLMRAALFGLGEDEHVLSLTLHHAITDGWSMERVLPLELKLCYEAALAGRDAPAAGFYVQYADFAIWQRERFGAEALEAQSSFWREHLSGLAPLELPTDRSRPPVQVFRSATQPFAIPPGLAADLQSVARSSGYTPAILMLAAWKVLLARYSGQEDLAVGTLNASRPETETEVLIGNFVRTQVIRTDLSGDPRFLDELMPRVREASLLAYEHEGVPFERLFEQRDPSRHPVFQVMFGMQYVPTLEARLGALEARALRLPSSRTGVDLDLRVLEEGGGLSAQLAYDTELFEPATIQRMTVHLLRLLEAIAANPDARLSELPLMPPAQLRRQVSDWNDTEREFGPDACVHELFEEQAQRTPEAAAVTCEGSTLSFRQLDERADVVAALLAARGIGPGSIVALCTERSFDEFVGLLGILKAGAAYVPLDPAHPERRLQFILSDTGAPVVLTQEHLLAVVPDGAERIALDRPLPSGPESSRTHRAATPDDAAYVIYTSGSTGEPKGVLGTHRGIVNRLRWQWAVAPWQPFEVACHKSNTSFVDSVNEIFGGLCAGVPTTILPEASVADPRVLVAALAAEGVTRLVVVPSHLAAILDSVDDLGRRLPKLWHWTTSGESLTGPLADRLLKQFPDAVLWNLYGSTEVAADATFQEVRSETLVAETPVPIGRPIGNTRCYVLDRWRQPVPQGLPGELFVGGAGVSAGYLKRPELTAERFVPDPYTASPDARLFATGDRVRQREDGVLEFLGRRDDQVTMRGFRIELGEVEAALLDHSGVRRAVTVLRSGRLVSYVLPEDGPVTSRVLRAFLRMRLPAYMVPAVVVSLESFPLTPSGKVDRTALPEPPPEQAWGDRAQHADPRDPLELQLKQVWMELLEVADVGIDDDFFDLGGNSLLAIRLFDRIEAVTGQRVPQTTLFTAPTVRQLAEVVRGRGWSPPWSALLPLRPGGSRPPFFCVPPTATTALDLHDLVQHLPEDLPVYALESPLLHGADLLHESIEEMAANYVEELRTLQPQGPYHLGGRCFGGVVAFEMAQQLVAAGEKVAVLAILDTLDPPNIFEPGTTPGPPQPSKRLRHFVRRSAYHLKGGLKGGQLFGVALKNVAWLVWQAYRHASFRTKLLLMPAPVRRVVVADALARKAYVTEVYPGRIALFQSRRGTEVESHERWSRVAAGGIDLLTFPDRHRELGKGPGARAVALKLAACLAEGAP